MCINNLPDNIVDDFNNKVRIAFFEDPDLAVRRIKYLMPYILQSIDWNEYGSDLEPWQIHYYYKRERFIEKTGLSFESFIDHQPLINSIENLGLELEPTFEFILFLKYYFGMRSELRHSSSEQLSRAILALNDLSPDAKAILDIMVGGKHFKITNTQFVKQAICMIDCRKLTDYSFLNEFNEGSMRDKIRAIDYYIVKTLLDYLPIDRDPNQKNFTRRMNAISVCQFSVFAADCLTLTAAESVQRKITPLSIN